MSTPLAVRGDIWLRAAWEAASDAMALSDPRGIVLAANPAYFALYGYGPADIVGKTFSIIFPPEERAQAEASYRQVFQSDVHPPAYEAVIQRRDGTQRNVEARVSFLEEDGTRIAMLNVIRDVTEATAARRAAAQADADRRTFLSSVSHDIKNPLAIIRGHAQALRRAAERGPEPPASGRLVAALTQIESSALQLAALVDELVAVTTLSGGELPPLNPAPADLVQLARAAVERHQRLADYHRVTLETNAETIDGSFDVARLERVFDNLISNAVKYSPEGGHITVALAELATDRPGALLTVSDQGIGIAPQDLPHVFERFRRGRNVDSYMHGTGVGLTSVKLIVEQHGGEVHIESEEGKGTTVTVWLPLEPPPPAPATAE
ncbi:MAG TPA: PAS domain-containing sensor histidine kinase [Chloroflexota bacterium]|nr:PAS domain-containing sensor histidine kinase [Chloroflexota bacterium]